MSITPLRFEVLVNGQRVAVVGTASYGVLSAIVNWVQRAPAAITDDVKNRPDFNEAKFLEETCRLELGGLDSATQRHFSWEPINLKPGDEVTVRIMRGGEYDSPPPRSNTSLERTRDR
jgi:hypothetical protein